MKLLTNPFFFLIISIIVIAGTFLYTGTVSIIITYIVAIMGSVGLILVVMYHRWTKNKKNEKHISNIELHNE